MALWEHLQEFNHAEYTPLLIAVSEKAVSCITELMNVSAPLKSIICLSVLPKVLAVGSRLSHVSLRTHSSMR